MGDRLDWDWKVMYPLTKNVRVRHNKFAPGQGDDAKNTDQKSTRES